ncbi:MAG: DNA-3-methyladenine glycosylase family protein [Thermoguttaceae bacterium]
MANSRRLLATGGTLTVASSLQCGQCFRWFAADTVDSFCGVVEGRAAVVSQDGDNVYIQTEGELDFWRGYFDLETDYRKITNEFPHHPFINEAVAKWPGLRVLRQHPWETLCSYLISQRNNIPRIRSTIQRLCEKFGDEIVFCGQTYYTFPTPEVLANMPPEELRRFGVGYRDKYITTVAKSVAEHDIDFDQLRVLTTDEARKELLRLYGVGKKVADCFLLYGLGKLDAFPVDTWIAKAIEDHGFGGDDFGEYAGVAQLYIFQHYRNGK